MSDLILRAASAQLLPAGPPVTAPKRARIADIPEKSKFTIHSLIKITEQKTAHAGPEKKKKKKKHNYDTHFFINTQYTC